MYRNFPTMAGVCPQEMTITVIKYHRHTELISLYIYCSHVGGEYGEVAMIKRS